MANFGRRTWDREEYAQLAQEEPLSHEETLKSSLSDAKLQQLKNKYTDHNRLVRQSMHDLNKKVLATGISSYKRGKQFGFYCELCDLTHKDTAQYIDHLNHKTHQLKFEAIFGEDLVADKRDNDDIPPEEFSKEYKTLVSRFVKQHASKPKATSTGTRIGKSQNVNAPSNPPSAIHQSMGFSTFGSTKM
ncbi:hypothetical protein ZYGR_0A03390 [Zygosaccharomyces rouxii]|uniref:ZYRO0A07722p n=2 Tax=Zygosaccharomyces rouxii TaxID=4956 RepID=C5DQ09_ZYGRC|nr:uncharacterized protein ZYRO0A07722g [Zygosaccharomyces rouxii]KAH9198709.1 hypothetical protein LQ764DRAFT_140045 [Zygosaccharomyces rouxii]GAV46744.1 hypothetical protein ZYGR_0A03390 [Zygosaccharomyces rouxii]CAR25770.1 ZYRO0A07722p [Zygosaccharomyces rouxii]